MMKNTLSDRSKRLEPHTLSLAYLLLGLNSIGVFLVMISIDTWSLEGLFLVSFVLIGLIGSAYGTYLLYNWLKPTRFFIGNGILLFITLLIFLIWFVEKTLRLGVSVVFPLIASTCFLISSILLIFIGRLISHTETPPRCPACKKSLGKWADETRCRWCGTQLRDAKK